VKKVALITGVMGGIGSATANAFLEQGWRVFGLDRNAPEDNPTDVHYIDCDLADPTAIEKAISKVAGLVDRMDALVNNAG
jgi:NAD(P)-dependent dehydrogenase (short-subunit alcohol dehydrogenase family)